MIIKKLIPKENPKASDPLIMQVAALNKLRNHFSDRTKQSQEENNLRK
jgi:hypothetical protein